MKQKSNVAIIVAIWLTVLFICYKVYKNNYNIDKPYYPHQPHGDVLVTMYVVNESPLTEAQIKKGYRSSVYHEDSSFYMDEFKLANMIRCNPGKVFFMKNVQGIKVPSFTVKLVDSGFTNTDPKKGTVYLPKSAILRYRTEPKEPVIGQPFREFIESGEAK